MNHLVIGTFVFSVGNKTAITSLSRMHKGTFRDIELISKTVLYKTARPLEEISIACTWINPKAQANINTLRDMIDTPQQVSDGQGNNLGQWIIKLIQTDGSHFNNKGIEQVHKVTITLLEAPQ